MSKTKRDKLSLEITLLAIDGILWAFNFWTMGLSMSLSRDWPLLVAIIGLIPALMVLIRWHPWRKKQQKTEQSSTTEELKKE